MNEAAGERSADYNHAYVGKLEIENEALLHTVKKLSEVADTVAALIRNYHRFGEIDHPLFMKLEAQIEPLDTPDELLP